MKTNRRSRTWVYVFVFFVISASFLNAQNQLFTSMVKQGELPIQIKTMDIVTRISGIYSETKATITFYNPNARVLEGELVFPLPQGAVVTGYALDVEGALVDGVVVKKETARVIFETEVRKGIDPGIVEQVAENVYRTRIYPLLPFGIRTVRITYISRIVTNTSGNPALHVPLPRLTSLGNLSLRVEVLRGYVKPDLFGFGNMKFATFEDVWIATGSWKDVIPEKDLIVSLPALPPSLALVERDLHGIYYTSISYIVDRQKASGITPSLPVPTQLGIAWDASSSRTNAQIDKEIDFISSLLGKWKNLDLTLIVFRNTPDAPVTFKVREGNLNALQEYIHGLAYDGGTDLSCLPVALKNVCIEGPWIIFTDGISTLSYGSVDFSGLVINAVTSQTVAERNALDMICSVSGGQLLNLSLLSPIEAADLFERPIQRLIKVHGEGLDEIEGIGSIVSGVVTINAKLIREESSIRFEYSDGSFSPIMTIRRVDAIDGRILSSAWAAARVQRLSLRADENLNELLALGQQFGIASPITSLIVLETLGQYLQYNIRPPDSLPDMAQKWDDAQSKKLNSSSSVKAAKLERVVKMWGDHLKWWNTSFSAVIPPKLVIPQQNIPPLISSQGDNLSPESAGDNISRELDPQTLADLVISEDITSAEYLRALAEAVERRAASRVLAEERSLPLFSIDTPSPELLAARKFGLDNNLNASIKIKSWDPMTPYISALNASSNLEEMYNTYMDWRNKGYSGNPGFYFDCADFFIKNDFRSLGIRILTNVAEMKFEEASLLRVLAWRFFALDELDLSILTLRNVKRIRPEEPQSLRDLALVLGERAKMNHSPADLSEAMHLLADMIQTEWARALDFPGIEVIALQEMNSYIEICKTATWAQVVDIPKLDQRLAGNTYVGIRIVLSWDSDNTDIDLHVYEPTLEMAYFRNPSTAIGGNVSDDFIRGYGPEQYILRRPVPGNYTIVAKYFGSSQQTLFGPVTVFATVYTDFGTEREKREVLTLRLDGIRGLYTVGSITVEKPAD